MWFLIAACLAVASAQRTDSGQQTIPDEYFGLLQQLIPNAPERGIIFTRTSEADANPAPGTVGNGHALHEARLRAALSGRNPNIALIQPYQQPLIFQNVPLQRTQSQPEQIDNSQKLPPAQPQVFLQTPQRQEVVQPQLVQGQRQQAVSVKQTQNTAYEDQQLQQKTVPNIFPHPFILQAQQGFEQQVQEERQQPPSQPSLSQTVQIESPQQEQIVYQQPQQNLKASRRLRPTQPQPQVQAVDSPPQEEIVYQQIQNEQALRRQRPTQQTLLQPIDTTIPQQHEVVNQQVLQEQPVRRLRPTQQSTLRTVEVQSPQEVDVVYQPVVQESGHRRQRPTQRPPLRNIEIQSPQDQELVYQPVQQEQPARRLRPTQQSQLRTVEVQSVPEQEQEVVYQQILPEPEVRRQRPTQQSPVRTIEIQTPQEQEVVYQQPLQDRPILRKRPTQQTIIQVQSPEDEAVYQQVYQRNQRTRPTPQPTLQAAVEQSPQQQEVIYQVDPQEPQLPRRRKPSGVLRTSQHQAVIQPVESEGPEQEQVIYQQVQQNQPIQRQRQPSVVHRQRPLPEQQQDVQIQPQEIPQTDHNIEQPDYQPRQNFDVDGIPQEANRAVPQEQYLRETTRPSSSRRRQKKPNTSTLFTRQRQEPQTDSVDKEVVSSLLGEGEDNYGIFPTPSSKSTIFVSESAGGKVSVSEENSEAEKALPVVRLPTPKGQRPLTQSEFQALLDMGFQVTPVTDANLQTAGRAILVPDGESQTGSEDVRHRQRSQIDPSRRRLRSRRPKTE